MKKKAIVLLAFAAALTAVSCQKEAMKEAETTPTGEGMTISAVTEGIGVGAKADLAYKYDVIWRTGDKICVKNSEKSADFTLSGGEGTTRGTFSSVTSISGEVEGFYPASVANLIWPAEQQNNQVPPMYCKKNLTSTQNQTFNFASLGSVLQLNFNSTTAGIVLKSIEVKADEAMSGAFTIENGQAKVSQPEGDKPGITLDLGEGVTLGTSAKKFNIAVPAGEYNNLTITFIAKDGQKCPIHATKAQSIEYNTVNTLAVSGEFKYHVESVGLDKTTAELVVGTNTTLVATVLPVNAADKTVSWSSDNSDVATVDATGKVTAVAVGTATITVTTTDGGKTATCAVTVKDLSDDALPGVFTVSDPDGKPNSGDETEVQFSRGNLWYGKVGDAQTATFNFEANQYGFKDSWDASHVSHFYWSKTESVAYAASYSGTGATAGDVFFTNADETTAKAGFTVNVNGKEQSGWRTLSTAEWQYLFSYDGSGSGGQNYDNDIRRGKYKYGVTVCGKTNCVVLLPDNWEWDESTVGTGWQTGGYPETATESNPVAWQTMEDAGAVCLPAAGYRNGSNFTNVGDNGRYWSSTADGVSYGYAVPFTSSTVSPGNFGSRLNGYSVRLVIELN